VSEVDPVSGTRLESYAPSTVETRPERMLLTERAADYLRAGPADARSLIGSVCQLSVLPELVAEHMAASLLGGHPRFVRTVDGRWRLSESPAPAWRTQTADEDPEGGDRITEIAVVTVRDGRIADVYETLVNPERSIPPFITRLTNISWEMVCDKAPFRDVCDDVLRMLEGHVFVAHNAAFDWRFVSAEVSRARGRELAGRRLCTVRLARRILPQLRSRSLDWVARHYNVEIEAGKRHRAAGDALATAHCLLRLLDDARGHGCERWSDLERFLAATSGQRKRRGRRPPAMPQSVDRDTTA
jgi:DNA polymerase-3 subunit epsilon